MISELSELSIVEENLKQKVWVFTKQPLDKPSVSPCVPEQPLDKVDMCVPEQPSVSPCVPEQPLDKVDMCVPEQPSVSPCVPEQPLDKVDM